MKFNISIISFLLISLTILASPKNVFYLSLDGVSRDTFFSLLQKDKLPNIQGVIKSGGVRNLVINNDDITTKNTLVAQFSGLNENEALTSANYLDFDSTIFNVVGQEEISYFLFYDNRANQNPSLFFKDFLTSNIVIEEKKYSYTSVFNKLVNVIQDKGVENKSHLIFANLAEPLLIARQSREGGEQYSESIQRFDSALGLFLERLRQLDLFDQTSLYITTNYALFPRSRLEFNSKIWLVSSEKIYYTGSQKSIVPTLLKAFDIPYSHEDYPAKRLTY